MLLAVISDLHLGSGGRTDSFGHDDSEFLRFLDFLERNFERIVLLGDIWETLTGALPGNPLTMLRGAQAVHGDIACRFERPRYSYVHGNHDIVSAARGVPEELVVDADGVRLLFTHGHQNDPIVARARWLSELGVWVGGWLRRAGFGSLYQLAKKLDGARGGAAAGAATSGFQRWAIEAARLRGADVVVTGHTHVAARTEHADRLFMNSGSCSSGAISFLGIDTRAGKFSVHDRW